MLLKARLSLPKVVTRIYRTLGGLWFPETDCVVPYGQNVIAFLSNGREARVIPAANIVTDDGNEFYAEQGASLVGEPSTTYKFGRHTGGVGVHVMCTAGPATPANTDDYSDYTPVAASIQAHDTNYPKNDDDDTDNTGADATAVTYRVSYSAGTFTGTIEWGVVTKPTPSGSDPLLTGYKFSSSFVVTASDTLKVFVNHTMLGA